MPVPDFRFGSYQIHRKHDKRRQAKTPEWEAGTGNFISGAANPEHSITTREYHGVLATAGAAPNYFEVEDYFFTKYSTPPPRGSIRSCFEASKTPDAGSISSQIRAKSFLLLDMVA